MKVAYQWLKQYIDSDLSPAELASKLTMVGLAVEHVEFLDKGIENVVVGQIKEIIRHPQADKLVVCQVDVGKNIVQIVTGATNVREGHKVPVALVGAKLPGGVKMKAAKLRGIESYGMLCSGEELGIDENYVSEESRGGIMILHPDAPVGKDAIKVLGLDDAVLEFELTPNRSDCLSVINVAREVSAVTGQEVSLPKIEFKETEENINDIASIEVKDHELCNRYVARVVKGVKLGPSPEWMQHFLRSAGVRPINNVVDVSNYVMLEMGQPLHTFDYDRLAGHKIIVRRAEEGEKMFTLDGQERTFGSDTLLICDGEKPVAVAGVMGGLDTEVTENTENILIEAARFHPVSIRRTSRMLGLRSESSLRFEKGLDVFNVKNACDRAAQLLAELCGGQVVQGVIDTFNQVAELTKVQLHTARVNQILGTSLTAEEVASFLKKLHFSFEISGEKMTVTIPSYRQDITREIDLIEEVARLNGYDKIPVTLPYGPTTEGKRTRPQEITDNVKDFLVGAGLVEVITYSFINQKELDKIILADDCPLRNTVKVKNPLSDEQGIMRTTLVPGLLATAALNTSRRNTDIAIFECGKIFKAGLEKLPEETEVLGILVSGSLNRGWNWPAQTLDFYFLKGVLTGLFDWLEIKDWGLKVEKLPPFLHPGRAGSIYVNNCLVGYIGEIHPRVQDNYDLEEKTCILQMHLAPLIDASPNVVRYVPFGKFPAVQRDMALLVPESVAAEKVSAVIWANGGEILKGVSLFDVYKGAQVPEGYKSLAYSLSFQAVDRTLTDEEVSRVFEQTKNELFVKFGVELR
ncbi:MAG: phenylalanine--tRNA ligase subunit beta [Bacillota bacterium]|jgi:phenylalanyl-tRNA synthetase beta chain|nr:phenylalanine--tRNA ligase subunit beta [Clostridia bacterium]